MTAEIQHVQQLANWEIVSHHISSLDSNGDTTFHPSTLGTSLVALEHIHIKNDNAVTIFGESRQDAAGPGERDESGLDVFVECKAEEIIYGSKSRHKTRGGT